MELSRENTIRLLSATAGLLLFAGTSFLHIGVGLTVLGIYVIIHTFAIEPDL